MNKQNLLISLLVVTILLLTINTLTRVPINVNRNYTNTTCTYTNDAAQLTAKWTVKYRAPLIIPKNERDMIERKIEIYMKIRLSFFTIEYDARTLFDISNNIQTIEELFNSHDVVKDLGKISPDLLRNVENIKSVKFLEFRFEKMIEDKLNSFKTQQALTYGN